MEPRYNDAVKARVEIEKKLLKEKYYQAQEKEKAIEYEILADNFKNISDEIAYEALSLEGAQKHFSVNAAENKKINENSGITRNNQDVNTTPEKSQISNQNYHQPAITSLHFLTIGSMAIFVTFIVIYTLYSIKKRYDPSIVLRTSIRKTDRIENL